MTRKILKKVKLMGKLVSDRPDDFVNLKSTIIRIVNFFVCNRNFYEINTDIRLTIYSTFML